MAPFKSTQSFSVGTFLRTFRNRDAVGGTALNSPVRAGAFTGTGGNYVLTPGNGYKYHTFTSPGSFVTTGVCPDLRFVLVAGGGGGGGVNNSAAGGGGGGGMAISAGFPCGSGTHPVTVGPGGVGQIGASGTLRPGSDSVFVYSGPSPATFTAKGGGGGDGPQNTNLGDDGGSGGGAGGAATQPTQNPAYHGITNYGNPAGYRGGGGAGAASVPNDPRGAGVGGDGQPAPGYEYPLVLPGPAATPLNPNSPTNNHYGGGGNGYPSTPSARAPYGGGGQGNAADNGPGNPGVDLLGGGGSFAWNPSTAQGGAGGDGIVIIKYAV